MRLGGLALLLAPLLGILAACGGPQKVADLPGWRDDTVLPALAAFRTSCAAIRAMPPERGLGGPGGAAGGAPTTAADWQPVCAEAASLPATEPAARHFFETRFTLSPVGEGMLTGYDEPELRGSLTPGPGYPAPLRARPNDLVEVDVARFIPDLPGRRLSGRVEKGRLVPYPDRAAIEAGAIDAHSLPLLWVADPAEKFFLQIQGSGRVVLPDGSARRVGYDGQNGRTYLAIGRLLIDRGALTRETVSRETILAWLRANPGEAPALMNANPSYVFFRFNDSLAPEAGPLGSLGVPLTPGRSIAVDRAHWPLGMPFWITARHPVTGAPLRRLVVAQDTGGAIRGEARGDLFWGWGAEASAGASGMKETASFFALRPR